MILPCDWEKWKLTQTGCFIIMNSGYMKSNEENGEVDHESSIGKVPIEAFYIRYCS